MLSVNALAGPEQVSTASPGISVGVGLPFWAEAPAVVSVSAATRATKETCRSRINAPLEPPAVTRAECVRRLASLVGRGKHATVADRTAGCIIGRTAPWITRPPPLLV